MTRLLIATIAWACLGSSSVFAQVGMGTAIPAPGITSPLGIGPGAPVAPTGIPLGAFELSSPGVSPTFAGAASVGPTAGQTACRGIGGSIPEASFGTASSTAGTSFGTGMSPVGTSASPTLFDGGGTAGTASGTCMTGSPVSSNPAASASSPDAISRSTVGRVGIPLGATELGVGGLSPPPVGVTGPLSSVSLGASTVPCPTTGMSAGMQTSTSTSTGGC
jgi:hypothetical protein